ncbi:MAG: Nif3-like dinuclear metal center hexameric protein [Flavobacteriales bacterium]|nr:Nif3-like dinuclear metal center hexameric protein [Flavobacteriales bacterium]
MRVKEIISFLEEWAPPSYQESYDNSGCIVGDLEMEVTGILCALDCIESVVDEAIQRNCNMIVAHHPILFSGIRKLNGKDYVERTIIKALKHDIAIYAIHTNLDNIYNGVNAKIAERIGLTNTKVLMPKTDVLSKLEFYCPEEEAEKIKESLFEIGVGNFSNYSNCSFNIIGLGTFMPSINADPSIGEVGKLHQGQELKVEVVFPSFMNDKVIKTLKKVHSYEEVAYQLIELKNADQNVGTGIIGVLKEQMEPKVFLEHLKRSMCLSMIRHTELTNKSIRKVAVVGGSGSFALPSAIAQQADIFISADFKYHQFFDADGNIIIADIGHYESEAFTIELLGDRLMEKFPNFVVLLSEVNTNPVSYT